MPNKISHITSTDQVLDIVCFGLSVCTTQSIPKENIDRIVYSHEETAQTYDAAIITIIFKSGNEPATFETRVIEVDAIMKWFKGKS